MAGSRHFSQRIAEGDGIAIIAHVDDADAAQQAEQAGAKAVAIARAVEGIRSATTLPLLWLGRGAPQDADASTVRPGDHPHHGIEAVAFVRDAEELEDALEELDPEIFLLCAEHDDGDDDPLDAVLELLPDVPAGKLAIAQVPSVSRDEVVALERAGMDAVLVPGADVAQLVGYAPLDL